MPSSDDATRKLRSGSREPLLRVEQLSADLPLESGVVGGSAAHGRVLESLDLRLRRGELLAIVGEAGAGKTTLVRVIAGSVPINAGRVLVEGKDLAGLGEADLLRVREQIRVVTPETLAAPGALASLGAKLLILDEAFDACDARDRLRLFMDIRQLQDEQGLSCLLLTRDIQLAGALSDQIVVMLAGQIVESGATASLLSHPQHPYTQSLLNLPISGLPSGPASADRGDERPACRFRGRCPQAFARCAEQSPTLFAVPGGLSRCFLRDPELAG